MNYLKIESSSLSNGTGWRVVLWVSGCNHGCFNCHNPESWSPTSGKQYTDKQKQKISKTLLLIFRVNRKQEDQKPVQFLRETQNQINQNTKITLRINLTWDNDVNYNSNDTKLGTTEDNKIRIPVGVSVTQYLGETITPYTE